MHLQNLQLSNFKNYTEAKISLCPEVNCFVGNNGAGKTNILDAVYYLSFTKSYFNAIDQQNIFHHKEFFSIEGNFVKGTIEENVRVLVQNGARKSVKVNNNEHKKFSDHIGLYPLVIITPDDIMLIHEGSEDRRKFLDGMISQTDKIYLNDLIQYNRVLEQRNKQLRIFSEMNFFDRALLDSFNEQLIGYGNAIYKKRRSFLESFIPVFKKYFLNIVSSVETPDLIYKSDLNETGFESLLSISENNDLSAQRTTKGIHKDELEFFIGDHPLKKFGSQGQQKSFIISLKLAQFEYLQQTTGIKPLLLLDDVFEKLDDLRLQKLLWMMSHDSFGQIFITDTNLERLKNVFTKMQNIEVKYFGVTKGSVKEVAN
ncbi:MAG: DNA replication/repair protein RecF [Bacteroidia bacterium]